MKRRWMILIVLVLALVVLSGCCEHQWEQATCKEPMTCAKCGEMEGEALGHEWIDATCAQPQTCDRCGRQRGETLSHTWQEADCVNPKTCTVCQITEGSALEHGWIDATCTAAKTCSFCQAVEGEPLEHSWLDATCVEPKTCSVCGATEGEPGEHQAGDWEAVDSSVTQATLDAAKYCTICGEMLEEKHMELETLHDGESFYLYPEQIVLRLNHIFEVVDEPYTCYSDKDGDGDFRICVENAAGELCARGWVMTPEGEYIEYADRNEADVTTLVLYVADMESETIEDLFVVMVCMLRTLDPSLTTREAEDATNAIAEAYRNEEAYILNDISYQLENGETGGLMLLITLRK